MTPFLFPKTSNGADSEQALAEAYQPTHPTGLSQHAASGPPASKADEALKGGCAPPSLLLTAVLCCSGVQHAPRASCRSSQGADALPPPLGSLAVAARLSTSID